MNDTAKISVKSLSYLKDTWNSLKLMVDQETGLVRDRMSHMTSDSPISSPYTSPTNIGLFISSLVAAKDLQLISNEEFEQFIDRILATLTTLNNHNGLFYNWYSTTDGKISRDNAFISTIDNAWLMSGLLVLRSAAPNYTAQISQLLNKIDLAFLYDPNQHLFYGGYIPYQESFTQWHYGLLNTEARIATYIGMNFYNIPIDHHSRLSSYSSVSNMPAYPSWGGSMFEVFMPSLFVAEIANQHWNKIYNYHLARQIEAGITIDGFWGFSPCEDPEGMYTEYGVNKIAVKPGGYGVGHVVTPHAAFLALACCPEEAFKNLFRLEELFPASYEKNLGFVDSVNIKTGNVSSSRLALDQSMSFLALYNYITNNKMHTYFNMPIPVFSDATDTSK